MVCGGNAMKFGVVKESTTVNGFVVHTLQRNSGETRKEPFLRLKEFDNEF